MNNPLSDVHNWMGEEDEPLTGFSWRAGANRLTSGIVIWSDVFLYDTKNEKLAIVLMDTHGLFDSSTTPPDNSRIFALGTLLSSTQIFNINDIVQEDHLQYLQTATDFARFAARENLVNQKSYTKPFQNLFFLMRDWSHEQSFSYGLSGGAQYIADYLHIKDDQHPDLYHVRNYIKSTFDNVECFLLPHPGFKIVSNQHYDGSWKDWNEEFKDSLEELIPAILRSKKLRVKRILGKEVDGKTFRKYATAFFQTFQSTNLTDIKTVYETAIEKQMEQIIGECLVYYQKIMKDFEDFTQPEFAEVLDMNHEITKNMTILKFKTTRKMGSQEYDILFERELEREIDAYHKMRKQSLLKTFKEVLEIQRQNKVALENLAMATVTQLNKHKQDLENLERENAEKLKRIKENVHKKQNEKELEIQMIEAENARIKNETHKRNQEMVEKLKEDLRMEEEKSRHQAEEEIKKLEESQNQGSNSIKARLQEENEQHLMLIQIQADRRREQNRLDQERREKEEKRLEH